MGIREKLTHLNKIKTRKKNHLNQRTLKHTKP